MVTVSNPHPPLSNPSMVEETDEVDVRKMDGLLEELKTSMVELIVQGDDVTHQMWRMYSVFEEIFGRQTMTTSSNQPLKHVVVGLKASSSSAPSSSNKGRATATPPTSPTLTKATSPPSTVTKVTTATIAVVSTVSSTAAQLSTPTSSTPTCSSPKDVKDISHENDLSPTSPQNKNYAPVATPSPKSSLPTSGRSSSSPGLQSGHLKFNPSPQDSDALSTSSSHNPTSNPLLDTIGALANSNQDSDDSDLDIVYQQLRYRGRQRKPEQMRMRTHRTHRHHQVASSDPESIGYAGSNSIDSGYKSLCATPEVSDSLSAPEVRRSASDVSASDSSTTSGRPRSLDGQDGKSTKIKMGTRSVAGKLKPMSPRHAPATAAMNDVTLDHLMYLRQSLRKDRSSPIDSIPSSATSSTFRDSDLSPRTLPDDEWRESSPRPPPYPFRPTSASSSSPDTYTRNSSRGCSSTVDQEGGGESSSDFLLSGVEYYDLESIQEFPTHNYVTMMHEEKTRCARMVSAPRCSEPLTERQLSSLYRKRSESTQSVDGDISRPHHHQNIYGMAGHPSRPARNSAKALSSRHHSRQHHATDSKLTEAAIRVLEMIEDFRMEEAMTRSGRMLPYQAEHLQGANPSDIHHHQQTILPRYRKASRRPASTGSLMEQEIDARSVASASSYAASAEHHVYEEIMYDLVCERGMERGMPPPIPPERGGRMVSRSRLLPVVPPHTQQVRHHQQAYASSVCVDPRRIMVRSSHKHRSSNMYSVLSSSSAHGRSNMDRFVEMEWHLAQQDRRDNLPPDFPV